MRATHATPDSPRRSTLAAAFVMALACLPATAWSAHFTVEDSVEGEITLRHDANFEFGVTSNGTPFGPGAAGSTTVPGELGDFTGGWWVNSAGSPDPGTGIIYVVAAGAPDRIKTVIWASWSTIVNPGLDQAEIVIAVLSSADCEDLGELPAAFEGLAIVAAPGGVGIAGQFRDPDTADPVSIPSNLGMTLIAPLSSVGGMPVDIKPRSCPNPLNTTSRGVLPVAFLGTEDFDVTEIDPETLRLEGVPALRWVLDDVATPYGDGGCLADCRDCHREGADGYLDLSLKFDRQELVAALGAVVDGECLLLELSGSTYDGTPVSGSDVVWIKAKGR